MKQSELSRTSSAGVSLRMVRQFAAISFAVSWKNAVRQWKTFANVGREC